MISNMTDVDETRASQAQTLCRSCGLCCTGHLFIWAKLRPAELDPAEALGLTVFRSDPSQRGFSQPCPLWQGECTIYDSAHYPHICRAYRCKLLKQVLAEHMALPEALNLVEQVKSMIQALEESLPVGSTPNFRERLVKRLETPAGQTPTDTAFRLQAEALLHAYEQLFGVTDVLEHPGEA